MMDVVRVSGGVKREKVSTVLNAWGCYLLSLAKRGATLTHRTQIGPPASAVYRDPLPPHRYQATSPLSLFKVLNRSKQVIFIKTVYFFSVYYYVPS